MEPRPRSTRPTRVNRRLLLPVAVALLPALLPGLAGCASSRPSGPPFEASRDPAASSDLRTATAVARALVAREGAHLTSAGFTTGTGTVTDSNTGHRCESGRLLHVRLVGDFPHIVTTGPVAPRDPEPVPDLSPTGVHAVLVTADAATGEVCRIGVSTDHVGQAAGTTVIGLDELDERN